MRRFFKKKFGFESSDYPQLHRDTTRLHSLDVDVQASGFTRDMQNEMEEFGININEADVPEGLEIVDHAESDNDDDCEKGNESDDQDDVRDEIIGAMQLEQKTSKDSDSDLDDKLPLLRSSYLNNNLQNIINETTKQGMPISFIMLDIDHFKVFNDKYGHLVGDDVLLATSTQISRIVGNKGKVVRFGGEEISIILPNYDIQEAKSLAERIRTTIEKYPFTIEGGEIVGMRVSAGISGSINYIEYKKLIEEADKALRWSKVKGRNQVNVFDKQIADLSDELVVIASIKDSKVKEFAEKALEAFKTENIEEFAKCIKLAFDCAFYTWKEKYVLKTGVIIPEMTGPELIRNNILNFNLVDFTKFESFLPHITWFESGDYQIIIKRSYTLPNDKENMRFCLKFFLNAIIEFKKQVDV